MQRRAVSLLSLIGVLVSCGSGGGHPTEPDPAATTTPATSAPESATVAPAGSAASGARKRKRTGPPKPLAHDGTKPKNGRPLNAKDDQGRTVFVREDDHCFVEVPPKDKPAEGAPISRETAVVDCPPATDDAAWDHCSAQVVLDESGTKCFCVSGAGNPRPMPRPTPCPAAASK
jgi:hypothetical protein